LAFIVDVPWTSVLRDTLIPTFKWSQDYWMMLVAVLGTTVSPYMFFWQAALEVEEQRTTPGARPLKRSAHQAEPELVRIRVDTYIGMAIANGVAFFIILTAAVTLHVHGVTEVKDAAQAATALRPIAGPYAFELFTLGIVGTGLLAIPALAGSAAFALGEAMRWPTGLELKPARAKGFYFVISASILTGTAIGMSGLDPIRALVLSSVINGLISIPILAVLTIIGSNERVMGRFVISRNLRIAGWVTTAAMAACAFALIANAI
jgi:Mn2+/Fe2+ NRAMP family transporter